MSRVSNATTSTSTSTSAYYSGVDVDRPASVASTVSSSGMSWAGVTSNGRNSNASASASASASSRVSARQGPGPSIGPAIVVPSAWNRPLMHSSAASIAPSRTASRASNASASASASSTASTVSTAQARTAYAGSVSGSSSRIDPSQPRSSSASQTSRDRSDAEEDFNARVAAPQAPVIRDTSGWEEAFASPHPPAGKTGDKDVDKLAAGIDELGLDPNLNAKKSRPGFVPDAGLNLPPPSLEGAWSFRSDQTLQLSVHQPTPANIEKHKQQTIIAKGRLLGPHEWKEPSPDYDRVSRLGSAASANPSHALGKRPKLVVLDLNKVLVSRGKATPTAARNAKQRPFLSSFLEYLCGSDEIDGKLQRRFSVMIWSSAEPASTVTMCEGLSLANADGDIPLLVDIWDRSSMDTASLPTFPVMKDLTKIWKGFKWIPPTPHKPAPGATLKDAGTSADGKQPWTAKDLHWSQYDTILVDDQRRDHVLQPNNQICVPQFKSNQPSAGASSGPARAMPGGRFGGAGKDTVMLQLVGALEALRHHSNVSAAMSLGYFHNIGRGDVQNEWASRGVKALQEKGIPVKEEFDRYWAIRLMELAKRQNSEQTYESPRGTQATVASGWD